MADHSSHSRQVARPPVKVGRVSVLENQQRRAYLLLLLFVLLVQVSLLANDLSRHTGNLLTQMMGMFIVLTFLGLLLSRRVSLNAFSLGAGYLNSVWTLLEIARVLLGTRPFLPSLLTMSSIAVLMAMSWLPFWPALLFSALISGGVSAVVVTQHPEALRMLVWTLYLNGFLVFLNLYNTRIYAERLRVEALEQLAYTDPLTGVLNRRGGWEQLEQMMAAPAQRGAVILLDIDAFKRINDQWGHALGDEVLQRLGQVLLEVDGRHGVARWGGEEFLLLLPQVDLAGAQATAGEILRLTRGLQVQDLRGVPVSMGLAMIGELSDPDALISLADQRMYAVKEQGGNAWRSD